VIDERAAAGAYRIDMSSLGVYAHIETNLNEYAQNRR
jgi:hypothetical protein